MATTGAGGGGAGGDRGDLGGRAAVAAEAREAEQRQAGEGAVQAGAEERGVAHGGDLIIAGGGGGSRERARDAVWGVWEVARVFTRVGGEAWAHGGRP